MESIVLKVESSAGVGVEGRVGGEQTEGHWSEERRGGREGIARQEDSLGIGRGELNGEDPRERRQVRERVVVEREASGVVEEGNGGVAKRAFFSLQS